MTLKKSRHAKFALHEGGVSENPKLQTLMARPNRSDLKTEPQRSRKTAPRNLNVEAEFTKEVIEICKHLFEDLYMQAFSTEGPRLLVQTFADLRNYSLIACTKTP